MHIPSPEYFYKTLPCEHTAVEKILLYRKTITDILQGADPRLLVIIGPCSIHNIESATEYAKRLQAIAKEVSNTLFIVMRAYFEKPRTAYDWKGLLYDPDLDYSYNFEKGIFLARSFLKFATQIELPTACEFVDPLFAPYISDFISWGCIGARTVTSQIHRQLAASLPMPVGFKNRLDGNIQAAISAIQFAKIPQYFPSINQQGYISCIEAKGNPWAHLVLRGGEKQPNYTQDSLHAIVQLLHNEKLLPSCIIDCGHDNARDPFTGLKFSSRQIDVAHSVLESRKKIPSIRGIMIESFLEPERQEFQKSGTIIANRSLTDPCIGWEQTEILLRSIAKKMTVSTIKYKTEASCHKY